MSLIGSLVGSVARQSGGKAETLLEANAHVLGTTRGRRPETLGDVGQVMRQSGGNANPALVRQRVQERLSARSAALRHSETAGNPRWIAGRSISSTSRFRVGGG